jgi:osmoprotectant transport system permease protein
MSFLVDVFSWFTDGDNWTGAFGIPARTWEHIRYSLSAVATATLIALPAGLLLGHLRRFGTLAVNVANIGRALPSLAILILAVLVFSIRELPFAGPIPTYIALVLLGIPPILLNAYTGMAEVDDHLREAAAGMGMTGWQQATGAELPNALPLVLAGVRTSAVQIVATATLAAAVGAGGLGRYIIDGIAVQDNVRVFAGALLAAMLAAATELFFSILERITVSPGVRRVVERSRPGADRAALSSPPI